MIKYSVDWHQVNLSSAHFTIQLIFSLRCTLLCFLLSGLPYTVGLSLFFNKMWLKGCFSSSCIPLSLSISLFMILCIHHHSFLGITMLWQSLMHMDEYEEAAFWWFIPVFTWKCKHICKHFTGSLIRPILDCMVFIEKVLCS